MYMRLVDDIVADLCADPTTSFTSEIAAQFVPVPSDAPADLAPGSRLTSAGQWSAPLVAELPETEGPSIIETSIPDVSRRQFFQGLAEAALVTKDEALSAVGSGTVPAAMEAVVTGLPDEQQFAVRMLLAGAQTFERSNAFVGVFAAAKRFDDAAVDALWRAMAAL